MLAQQHFAGTIVIEINTRKALDRADREADLAEALAFTRLNLAAGPDTAAGLRPRKPLPHIPTGPRFRASSEGIDDLYGGDARRATP
jgi:hypothetical protein